MRAAPARVRRLGRAGELAAIRTHTANHTVTTHSPTSSSIHPRLASLPVPSPCRSATGQQT